VNADGNAPPEANDDSATTDEDSTAITINVLANDSDLDGDTLTTAAVLASTPSNGAAAVNPDGTIEYTPNPNFNGQDTFEYSITDGNGGNAIATGAYYWMVCMDGA